MNAVNTLMARVEGLTTALGVHETNVLRQGLLEGGFMICFPMDPAEEMNAAMAANAEIAAARVQTKRSRRVVLAHVTAVVLGVDVDAAKLAAIAAGAFDDTKET